MPSIESRGATAFTVDDSISILIDDMFWECAKEMLDSLRVNFPIVSDWHWNSYEPKRAKKMSRPVQQALPGMQEFKRKQRQQHPS